MSAERVPRSGIQCFLIPREKTAILYPADQKCSKLAPVPREDTFDKSNEIVLEIQAPERIRFT
jgi:hypothetical protein